MEATRVQPHYLEPYHRALRRHGAGFGALLWATPQTQVARFEALSRACDFADRSVLDAGCGRADLLDWLIRRGTRPSWYVGLEAIEELATLARAKSLPDCQIVQADFLREPARLLVGAQIVVFCGSLNTLSPGEFSEAIRRGFEAAQDVLLLNFLSSPTRAGASWLTWHDPGDVDRFARTLTPHVRMLQGYIDGDCTMSLGKRASS